MGCAFDNISLPFLPTVWCKNITLQPICRLCARLNGMELMWHEVSPKTNETLDLGFTEPSNYKNAGSTTSNSYVNDKADIMRNGNNRSENLISYFEIFACFCVLLIIILLISDNIKIHKQKDNNDITMKFSNHELNCDQNEYENASQEVHFAVAS